MRRDSGDYSGEQHQCFVEVERALAEGYIWREIIREKIRECGWKAHYTRVRKYVNKGEKQSRNVLGG